MLGTLGVLASWRATGVALVILAAVLADPLSFRRFAAAIRSEGANGS